MVKRIISVFLGVIMLFTGVFLNSTVVLAKESSKDNTNNKLSDKSLPSGFKYSELKQSIEGYIAEHKATTASVAVSVFDKESTIYQTYYGYTDIENKIKADENSVYEWGSATKTLVWVSVMQLWEQGKIKLDEDVSNYLPKGFFTKRNFDKPITMINLMNHNAGFEEVVTDLFLRDTKDIKDLGEMLRYIEPEQIYEPGTVEAYSNWSVALAGYIVECISGEKFADYVHNHIFKPLGMEHSALLPTLDDNQWVKAERKKLQGYTADTVTLIPNSFYYIGLYAAGMCTGTLSDFEKFAKELVIKEGDTSRLFKNNSTLKEMLTPTMYFSGTNIAQNCHGFWTLNLGVQVVGHGGNTAGCSSYILIDPKSGVGVVVMTNQRNESIYNLNMMKYIYGQYTYDERVYAVPDIETTKGVYMQARTVTKGPFSIDGFLSTKLDFKYGKDTYTNFWVYSSQNGIDKKSGSYTSFVKLSLGKYIFQVVLLGLAAIALLYSLITLIFGGGIINVIMTIRRKMYKREKEKLRFRKYNYIVCGLITIFPINISAMFYRLFNYTTWAAIKWQVVANALILLFVIAYMVFLIVKFRKLECRKREKVKYVFTAVMCLFIAVNIIYWEMYKFF